MNELSLLTPIGVVLAAALTVVFVDLWLKPKDRYVLPWLALAGCVLGLYFAAAQLYAGQATWLKVPGLRLQVTPLILNGAFCIDGFGIGLWLLACIAGALALLIPPSHTIDSRDSSLSAGEYYGLILLTVAGIMLLGVSYDWVTLLLSLEVMSISTYILTGADRGLRSSNEAALKYLVLGAFSTAFLLLGIAFYYGATGHISLNLGNAVNLAPDRITRGFFLLLGMGLIFVGALFKTGAAPFHFWIPDVYQGAPTAVTGLMSVGVKAAAFAVFVRIGFDTFGSMRGSWMPVVTVLAAATMIVGNVLAIRQENLKRMLAYSGIAHTGYLMLALLVFASGNVQEVYAAHSKTMLFYLFVYGVMTLGAFGVIAMVRQDGRPLETFADLKGFAKEHPGLALCMAIFMFSMAGLPPTGGFFAKFMIFRSAVEQGYDNSMVLWVVVIGVLTSVVSLYYYLRVVVAMYMPSDDYAEAGDGETAPARCQYAWNSNLLIYAAGVVALLIGVLPNAFWFWK